jgi:hypothetical protein
MSIRKFAGSKGEAKVSLKFYADGRLMRNVPKSEMGKIWRLTEQMMIWVDSETFRWEGFPGASELPIDYEIEYIRVWQKKDSVTVGTTSL